MLLNFLKKLKRNSQKNSQENSQERLQRDSQGNSAKNEENSDFFTNSKQNSSEVLKENLDENDAKISSEKLNSQSLNEQENLNEFSNSLKQENLIKQENLEKQENLSEVSNSFKQEKENLSQNESLHEQENLNKQANSSKNEKTSAYSFKKIALGLILAVILGILCAFLAHFYLKASFKVCALIGIMALLVTLWTNKALPLGVVSLLPIILFPSFGILDTKSATSNYANPIIFLFLGGFMLATATEKIGLHKIIAKKFLSFFPKTPKGVISALGFASAVLGTALSNSTVAILLLPVALSISKDYFLKLRFLLAVAFGASISGITTPIGSPPNLIFLGFLESLGFEGISFTTWIFMMLPLTLLMLYAMIKILAANTKEHPIEVSLFDKEQITFAHKRLTFFIAALLLLLFINSPIKPIYSGLGLNENVILLAFGLLMFVPKIGFLDWDDSKSIPYELIFLFGAGFCIANAFSGSELSRAFEGFFSQFSSLPFIVFLFLACLSAIIATGFLSTTALIAILLPIVYTATQSFLEGKEPAITMLAITICASFSFMIPISTPPNAIVFAKGNIKAWDMIRFGFLLSIVGIIAVTLFSYIYWRWFLGV